MAVRLKISDPVIIAQGPRYKDVGWGEFQFPLLGDRAEDGTIYASVQITEDSGEAYGARLGRAFFISKDEGEHWEALLVYTDFYVPDENGENRKTLLCRKIAVEE